MKIYSAIILLCIISFRSFSQDQKEVAEKPQMVKMANEYYNSYRFADANKIYEELLFKHKINIDKNSEVYRNAFFSGIKANDFWFALKISDKFQKSVNFNFDDAYSTFFLQLFLGNYEKLADIYELEQISNASGPKKDLLVKFSTEKPWINLLKDQSGSEIEYKDFNSGKGDFGPVLLDGKISFSSRRNNFGPSSTFDKGSFIDQFIFDENSTEITEIKDLKIKRHDGASFYDKSSKTWYYSKNLKTQKDFQLTRTGIYIYNDSSAIETEFTYNNIDYFVAQPYFSSEDNTLYFSSDMPGGIGKSDLWKSTFENGTWSTPVNLGKEINTIEDEMFPYFFENTFYFASSGHPGLGGLDVFTSTKTGNSFGKPFNMGMPLNSYGDDFALVLKEDGENGYYTNSRKDFLFVDNIYAFQLKNLKINFMATVLANTKNKEPLKNMLVVVKNENNKVIDTLFTDSKGVFHYPAKTDSKYSFFLGNEDYDNHEEIFSTKGIDKSDTIKRKILMNPKSVLVNAVARNEKTNEVLPNTLVQIVNKTTGEIIEEKTDDKGLLSIRLPRDNDYELVATRKNFVDKLDSITTKTKKLEIDKDLLLSKLTAGTTFTIENVLYDFAKANLRPESKIELDKLAEFLLKNDNIKVELSSHTDSRGSDAANKKLSQSRAQSCVDYLLTKGIQKTNIVAKGYGESKLVNKCSNGAKCSDDEHQANRRTEIKILSVTE